MLSYTPDLERAIAEARDHLHAHHDIEVGQRQAIYVALGEWGEENIDTIGYRRRTRLALLSTYYVLPLVERLVPTSRCKDLLRLAEQILSSKQDRLGMKVLYLSRGRAWWDEDRQRFSEIMRLHTILGGLSMQDAYATVEQVTSAVMCALGVALVDDFNFPKLRIQHPETPTDALDDAAGWAWVAYRDQGGIANGYQAIKRGDRYWLWWIQQAIPLAWSSVQ